LFHRTDEKKLPEYLHAIGKYNFNDESVVLCMYADKFDWSLVSITGTYDFNKIPIAENRFEEITGNDFVYNIAPLGETIMAKVFKFDASKIDRHVLMKQFTVQISYIFLEDVDLQLHTTKYKFEVSSLMPLLLQTHEFSRTGSIFQRRNSREVQVSRSLPRRSTHHEALQLQIQTPSRFATGRGRTSA
jgi:hypothetical protein